MTLHDNDGDNEKNDDGDDDDANDDGDDEMMVRSPPVHTTAIPLTALPKKLLLSLIL